MSHDDNTNEAQPSEQRPRRRQRTIATMPEPPEAELAADDDVSDDPADLEKVVKIKWTHGTMVTHSPFEPGKPQLSKRVAKPGDIIEVTEREARDYCENLKVAKRVAA